MFDLGTSAPRSEAEIYFNFGHYYVQQAGQSAANWRELEQEAARSIVDRGWDAQDFQRFPCPRGLADRAQWSAAE